jgi:SAM-dependent methyltransferase
MDKRIKHTLRVYQREAETYLGQWGRGRYRRPRLLMILLTHLPKNSRILDAGCGPGQDVRYLSSRGYRAVGVDGTREFLSWARHKDPAGLLISGDLQHLPFSQQSFDAVWAAASLIHLPKTGVRQTLASLRSITRSGGWMAATFLHGKNSGVLTQGWVPGRYFSRWIKGELERSVHAAGWKIVRLECVTGRERKGRWINLLACRGL